jgi:hypothetical protein
LLQGIDSRRVTIRIGTEHNAKGDKTMNSIFETEQVNVDAIKPNDAAQALYLDWVNNFLTVTKFAEHYQLTEDAAEELIAWGALVHEQRNK